MACSKGELLTGSVSNEEVVLKSSAGAFGFRAFVAQTPLPPLTQDIELVYLPVLHLRISFTVNLRNHYSEIQNSFHFPYTHIV